MDSYVLPELPYSYDALRGYISEDIMRLHHGKHHQGYVDKLNAALSGVSEGVSADIVDLLRDTSSLPEGIRQTVVNNGGGHYNHSLFWESLTPNSTVLRGNVEELVVSRYGSVQGFIDKFTTEATNIFGSGWAWLQPNGDIITTSNQDTPFMNGGEEPLLGLDVWEHAYYLDYKNSRADYVKAWWNIVNWDFVEDRLSRLSSR